MIGRVLGSLIVVPILSIPTILMWFGSYGLVWCIRHPDNSLATWEAMLATFGLGMVCLLFPLIAWVEIWDDADF